MGNPRLATVLAQLISVIASMGARYHQASDASLNLWVLMPVVLVVALVGIARKVGRS